VSLYPHIYEEKNVGVSNIKSPEENRSDGIPILIIFTFRANRVIKKRPCCLLIYTIQTCLLPSSHDIYAIDCDSCEPIYRVFFRGFMAKFMICVWNKWSVKSLCRNTKSGYLVMYFSVVFLQVRALFLAFSRVTFLLFAGDGQRVKLTQHCFCRCFDQSFLL